MSATPTTPPAAPTRRWPVAGSGQKPLLFGSLAVLVGSVLPWVMTPFGNIAGVRGGGLWTAWLAVVGIAGAVMPGRRLALAHAAVVAAGVLGVGLWQVGRLLQIAVETRSFVAVPGLGLVLAVTGGVFAAKGALALFRRT